LQAPTSWSWLQIRDLVPDTRFCPEIPPKSSNWPPKPCSLHLECTQISPVCPRPLKRSSKCTSLATDVSPKQTVSPLFWVELCIIRGIFDFSIKSLFNRFSKKSITRFFPYYTFNLCAGFDSEGKGVVYGYDAVGSGDVKNFVTVGSGAQILQPILDQ
jgi:hypothetical protein